MVLNWIFFANYYLRKSSGYAGLGESCQADVGVFRFQIISVTTSSAEKIQNILTNEHFIQSETTKSFWK